MYRYTVRRETETSKNKQQHKHQTQTLETKVLASDHLCRPARLLEEWNGGMSNANLAQSFLGGRERGSLLVGSGSVCHWFALKERCDFAGAC
jgi:hypothetical protein